MKLLFTHLLVLTCSFIQAQEPTSMELLTQWMTGSFNSEEQAERDTNYLDISLEMVRIWPERNDGVWLYVEQAASADRKHPYRQRIYQLTETDADKFTSIVYQLPDPTAYIGAYKKPKQFKKLSLSDLTRMDPGCEIHLVYMDRAFSGSNHAPCPNTWQGASFASSEVRITQQKLVSWDRGWSDKGELMWGAKGSGYEFVRQ